jgi:arylsulfatase A-like enzyme
MRAVPRALPLIVLALAATGCGSCREDAPSPGAQAPAPRSSAEGAVADREVRKLFDLAARCDLEHRGVLVDFGTAMVDGRVSTPESTQLETVEHDGATWSVITERSVSTRFVQTKPSPIRLSARFQPEAAKSMSFYVDDVYLGSSKLKGSDPRVVETPATELALDPGEHTVTVRFTPAKPSAPYGHLDWLSIGHPDDLAITFGAPTLDDVLAPNAVLAKVPHRAFSLLAPTTVRCPVRVPEGGRLRTAVGMVGAGEGEIEIAVRVDGEPTVVLGSAKLKGGEEAAWQDLDFGLDPFASKLVHVELHAKTGSRDGRILFGDPEISVPTVAPGPGPAAQVVIVVVLAGIAREELPGYADRPPPYFERLRKLAERGVTFKEHRAPSTVVPATVATLLTGLPPDAHTLTDYGARLPSRVPTVVTAAQHAGYEVGWFTAVPYSTAAFGLGPPGQDFLSPVQGDGADALARAATWLEAALQKTPDGKVLLFVHARGGHPPWVVDPKLADSLPPENYTGDISPRRAAQQLASIRGRRKLHQLPETDQTRLAALYQLALAQQDRSLGAIVDVLDELNVADRTLVVVTSDGSTGLGQLFTQTPPLDDRTLALPLYVVFPGGAHAGQEMSQTTEVVDVARTLSDAMRLAPARGGFGRELAHVAAGRAFADDEPLVAREGDASSTRWGSWVLVRNERGGTRLCELVLDPTCSFDRRSQAPLTAAALERALAAHERRTEALAVQHEPATIDDDTLAALRVWGAMD